MLGISCPVEDCYTPLVRNKQGKAKKQREEQLALQKQQEDAAAAAEAEAEEQERKRRIEQQFRLQEQAKQALDMQQLEQLAASRAATANGAGTISDGALVNPVRSLEACY
ncbi:hypothetical protein BBJ28_00000614 [Nothophytophthora sp. Chile5]|nr:hypothetical protein BBJ28_00000614 [Nothophytophthora sp. Chile5]